MDMDLSKGLADLVEGKCLFVSPYLVIAWGGYDYNLKNCSTYVGSM